MMHIALTPEEFSDARAKIEQRSSSIVQELKAIAENGGGTFEPCVDKEAAQASFNALLASRKAANQRLKRKVICTRAWIEANEDCNLATERVLAKMRKPEGGYWTEADWVVFRAKHGIAKPRP